jgi:hypothetical protein
MSEALARRKTQIIAVICLNGDVVCLVFVCYLLACVSISWNLNVSFLTVVLRPSFLDIEKMRDDYPSQLKHSLISIKLRSSDCHRTSPVLLGIIEPCHARYSDFRPLRRRNFPSQCRSDCLAAITGPR